MYQEIINIEIPFIKAAVFAMQNVCACSYVPVFYYDV